MNGVAASTRKRPDGSHLPCGHLLFGFVDHRQDRARVLQEGGAFLGQFQPPRGSSQQRGLQLSPDGLKVGWWPRSSASCSAAAGDRAGVHYRGEGQQFVEGGFHC
jgi:hypothetical protein